MEYHGMQYVLRGPVVKLERCDKIWETLKLIRSIQDVDSIDESDDNEEEVDVAKSYQLQNKTETSLLPDTHKSASYIKYHPVLNNGNTALPNFRFSVKSTKKVYCCETCGRQYNERRSMRVHSAKVHGIIIPGFKPWAIHKSSRENNIDANAQKLLLCGTERLRSSARRSGESEKNDNEPLVSMVSENVQNNTESIKSSMLQDMESENSKYASSVQKTLQNVDSVQVGKASSPHNKYPKVARSYELEKPKTRNTVRQPDVEPENANASINSNNTSIQSQPKHIQCTLCNRHCKNISKHLTEYHKIKYPDLLIQASIRQSHLKNDVIQNTSNVDASETSKSSQQNKTHNAEIDTSINKLTTPTLAKESHAISEKRQIERAGEVPEKRYRYSDEYVKLRNKSNPFQCDICLGIYSDIRKHRVRHKRQGETKENFHLFECRYTKSPFKRSKSLQTNNQCSKIQNSPVNASGATDVPVQKDNSYPENNRIQQYFQPLDGKRVEQLDDKAHENSVEYKCDCGRYFRNSYTLFSHRGNCKHCNNADAEKSSVSRTSSDRDSGIGISITIKKRNDSYEIVSRESSDESKSKDYELSGICDVSSDSSETSSTYDNDDFNDQTLDSLEYSKDHSILKLEVVEEDIDVDIEDNSLSSSCNANVKGLVTANRTRKRSIERNNNMQNVDVEILQRWEVPSLTILCKKVLAKHRIIGTQYKTYNCRKCQVSCKNKGKLYDHMKSHKDPVDSCTCGIKFYSVTDFNIHLVQFHPLCMTCAYCNEKFDDIARFEEHRCYIVQGKTFEEPFVEALCSKCNTIFDTFSKLYRHFKVEHTNPSLPYRCYKCPDQFPNRGLQQIHFNVKHSCSFCSVCNKAFYNEYIKFKHEAYHRGLGFPCHSCKKAYFSNGMLANHTGRVHGFHSNEDVICIVCLKTVKATMYQRHLRQHNTIIECEICHKRLYKLQSLKKHIGRFHQFEYPFKMCRICGMSFVTNEYLEMHIKTKKHYVRSNVEEKDSEGQLLAW